MKLQFLQSKRWLTIIWVALVVSISIYSILPNRSLPEYGHFDDVCRFLAFAVLAFLPFLAFPRLRNSIYISLTMAVLGLILEQFKKTIPGRHYSVENMIVNDSGVILGFVIGMALRYIRRNGRK